MRALGRVFASLIGFCAAVIAAAVFLIAAKVGWQPPDPDMAPLFWTEYAVTGAVTASFLGSMAMIPAFVAILVAEVFRLRSIFYHVGVGGLLGASAALGFGGLVPADGLDTDNATLMVAAGFVAGLVYWLVAGRTAGLTEPAPADERR